MTEHTRMHAHTHAHAYTHEYTHTCANLHTPAPPLPRAPAGPSGLLLWERVEEFGALPSQMGEVVGMSLTASPWPTERRGQGLCARVQKWLYEHFGEYLEDFRFQPEESPVEAEEPLSARRWGPDQAPGDQVGLRLAGTGLGTWRGTGMWGHGGLRGDPGAV